MCREGTTGSRGLAGTLPGRRWARTADLSRTAQIDEAAGRGGELGENARCSQGNRGAGGTVLRQGDKGDGARTVDWSVLPVAVLTRGMFVGSLAAGEVVFRHGMAGPVVEAAGVSFGAIEEEPLDKAAQLSGIGQRRGSLP